MTTGRLVLKSDREEMLFINLDDPRCATIRISDLDGGITRATELAESIQSFLNGYPGFEETLTDYEIHAIGDDFVIRFETERRAT